jgi:hypothetical protein
MMGLHVDQDVHSGQILGVYLTDYYGWPKETKEGQPLTGFVLDDLELDCVHVGSPLFYANERCVCQKRGCKNCGPNAMFVFIFMSHMFG